MTESVSKSVEDLERERDEWRELAIAQSLTADKAVATVVELSEKLKASPPGTVPPKAAAPAPPPAPPVPMPATLSEWTSLSSAAKAAVRSAHGEGVEERLHQEFLQRNRMNNLRGGMSAHVTGPVGGVHLGAGPGRLEDYYAGAPQPFVRGEPNPQDAALAALRQNIGTGGPARPAAPVRPIVHGSGPSGSGKSRALRSR